MGSRGLYHEYYLPLEIIVHKIDDLYKEVCRKTAPTGSPSADNNSKCLLDTANPKWKIYNHKVVGGNKIVDLASEVTDSDKDLFYLSNTADKNVLFIEALFKQTIDFYKQVAFPKFLADPL